jgi:uncharacterized double-CXXCG motif protein
MRFYLLEHVPHPRYSGYYSYGHKWSLPGTRCPVCHRSGAGAGNTYPSVDLSHLPAQEQKKYLARFEEDYTEFERLREQVRPLVPAGALLRPGTQFGPMDDTAWGEFAPLALGHSWDLLMQREPLERLQAEGLRGLKGVRTQWRFRKKNPPQLWEMELLPQGTLHPACLPELPPPCPKCESAGLTLPEELILDADTLPQDRDLFRLADARTLIICTERFVEAVRRLGYEQDLAFRKLPLR